MHYPGHMRDVFAQWVEEGQSPLATVEVQYEAQHWPAEKVLRRMWHCSDTMLSGLCSLEMPQARRTPRPLSGCYMSSWGAIHMSVGAEKTSSSGSASHFLRTSLPVALP